MPRPRVLILPWTPGWSYASTAAALSRHLADRFEITVAFDVPPGVAPRGWDLVVDMSWKGKTLLGDYALLRQISSHRWRRRFGGPRRIHEIHLKHADVIAVPSLRLLRLFGEMVPEMPVRVCPKGFEPAMFFDQRRRRGELVIGWAGEAGAIDKGVKYLRRAWPELRVADHCLTLSEMADFYNELDVIACASSAEGDPRTVIEGMACGCYVVSTNVGIVPELVRDQVDGIIVERSVRAFREAFDRCAREVAASRSAGAANAMRLASTRRWSDVAPAWGDAFDEAIRRRASRP